MMFRTRQVSASAQASGAHDGSPGSKYRGRWWTLIVLSVSLLVVIVDDTIVNVALPTLQRELDASASALQWIVNSYVLVFGGLLLTMGTLGDRFGRRRFLRLGFAIFGAASLYGAFADSTGELIAARAAMGVGGAMIMPATLSVITDVFPKAERVKAIGIWAAVAHLGIPLGPVLGGWLLEHYWWGAVLLVNVPIVAGLLLASARLVPESRNPDAPRSDILGMLLSTVALGSLLYVIIEGPEDGWMSAAVIGGLAVALSAALAFVVHERRTTEPMIDLRLFTNARLRWATIAITLAMFALAGLTFDLTQYLQFVKGYTPLEAGVRILPLVVGFAAAAHIGQHAVQHLGMKRALVGGLLVIAALFALLTQLEPSTAYWPLGIGLAVIGLGLGTVFIPSTDSVMAEVPEANAGLGSALNDTSRQIGAALGIAVIGSVTNAVYSSRIEDALEAGSVPLSDVAQHSIGAALQAAGRAAGPAGKALESAAADAFSDGFAASMAVGAALLFVGAVALWRRLAPAAPPAHGAPADGTDPHRFANTSTYATTVARRDHAS